MRVCYGGVCTNDLQYVYLRMAGPHTLLLTVTAESGAASLTYSLSARKFAPMGDARLAELAISGGGVLSPVFDPDTFTYHVQVPVEQSLLYVTARALPDRHEALDTHISVAGVEVKTGQMSSALPLNEHADTTIVVSSLAQDGLQTATYSITVTKLIPPPPPLPPPPPVLLTYLEASPARWTSATDAVFNFSTPDATSHLCSLDGAPLATCPGDDAASASYTHLVEGPHSLYVRALGSSAGAVPVTYNWTIDNLTPAVTLVGSPYGRVNSPKFFVSVKFSEPMQVSSKYAVLDFISPPKLRPVCEISRAGTL